MNPLFPALPDDLSALTAEDLEALAAGHLAVFKAIKANDPETLGDRNAQEIVDQAKAGKESLAAVKAEQDARKQAEETYETEIETLTADLELEELEAATETTEETAAVETTAEAETETTETETAEELEAVTAARVLRRPLPRTRQHAPAPVVDPEDDSRLTPVVASAGLQRFSAGQPLTEDELGQALADAIRRGVSSTSRENVVIASVRYADKVPEERHLRDNGMAENTRKIGQLRRQVEEGTALTAAGQGNCAPLTPYYKLQNITVQDRPVRDSLAGFTADRGGITFMPPPSLADIEDLGAVGVITEADQAAGGTFAVKSCGVVLCDDIVSQQVDQVYKCLQFGNLQSRAYPELVAHDNDLAMAAHARLAETLLLDSIKAGSTNVTGVDVSAQGAVNNYFGDLIESAAGIRSVNRMAVGATIQGLAPSWMRDLLTLDLIRGQFDRWEWAQNQIDGLLARYGIEIAWYLDGSSNGNQVFGPQSGGALNEFPTTAETALFPPGTWLFLDAGTLDLGIVRDSTLNSINAYQLFAETFEHAVKVGVVSYWLTSTICPNGVVVAPSATTFTCS